MILGACVKLSAVESSKEKQILEDMVYFRGLKRHPTLFSAHEAGKEGLSVCIQSTLASAGLGAIINGERVTYLNIVDEATEYLRGSI